MNRWHPFFQLFISALREFYREPEALFWVYGFPVLLAVGLGVAFANREPERPVVDVQQTADPSAALALTEHLQANGVTAEVQPEEACRQRLRSGKTALVIVPESGSYRYVYDTARQESLIARYQVDALIQRWRAGSAAIPTSETHVSEPGSRYIDFLIP